MENLQIEFIQNINRESLWLFACYAGVAASITVDLFTGVGKSRKMGHKSTSRGYKRTCRKARDYYVPMIVLTCIDLITSVILPVPALTMLAATFCIFCEFKSVMETAYDKEAIRRTAERLYAATEADNRHLVVNLLRALLSSYASTEKGGEK